MTQNLSSSALVKPAVKDAKAEADIPASYGKTESYLLPKDPAWLFLFWEITAATIECIKSQYSADVLNAAKTIIRLYDVTGISYFDGTNAVQFYDMPVIFEARSWYINAPATGRSYVADLGYLTADGRFILVARSNQTLLPPGKISDIIDDKWMIVEGDFQKIIETFRGGLHRPGRQRADAGNRPTLETDPAAFFRHAYVLVFLCFALGKTGEKRGRRYLAESGLRNHHLRFRLQKRHRVHQRPNY